MVDDIRVLAGELVCAVHDSDAPTCHRILENASRGDLHALAVCLAASVRQDDPLLAQWKAPVVSVPEIVEVACSVTGCSQREFYGDEKYADIVNARHIAWWVGSLAGYTYVDLGKQMKKHHTTVMNGVQRVTRDPELHKLADQVVERIGGDLIRIAASQGAKT
jgi:hypothetical protein